MAFRAGTGVIQLKANTKPLQGIAGKIGKAFGPLGAAIASPLGIATLAIGALTAGLRKAIDLATIQQQAEAKLAAVIKATGNAAGFTAEQLFDQAKALQAVTIFGDETIISAQAIIATFKNIRGDAFARTTQAVADMATVMGTDLKSATLQVAKALNDPATGLTLLNRSGVTFSQTQKDIIKGFVETNQLAEAQGVILGELESQFGGAAESQTKTFGGAIQQLKNTFGDFLEIVGEAVGPAVADFGKLLIELLPVIKANLIPLLKTLAGIFSLIVVPIAKVISKLNELFDFEGATERFLKGFEKMATVLTGVFESISKAFDTFLKPVIDAFSSIREFLFGPADEKIDPFTPALAGAGAGASGVKNAVKGSRSISLESSAADAARRIQKSALEAKDPVLTVAKQQLDETKQVKELLRKQLDEQQQQTPIMKRAAPKITR